MKLPLDSYSTEENAEVGAWALLEVGDQEQGQVRNPQGGQPPMFVTLTSRLDYWYAVSLRQVWRCDLFALQSRGL